MKRWILLAVAVTAAAPAEAQPEDQAVVACSTIVQAAMKQPASYKMISADLVQGKSGGAASHVIVSYDGMNSFGAVLRGQADCLFDYYRDAFHLFSVVIDGTTLPLETFRAMAVTVPKEATKLQPPL